MIRSPGLLQGANLIDLRIGLAQILRSNPILSVEQHDQDVRLLLEHGIEVIGSGQIAVIHVSGQTSAPMTSPAMLLHNLCGVLVHQMSSDYIRRTYGGDVAITGTNLAWNQPPDLSSANPDPHVRNTLGEIDFHTNEEME